jgi:hypothetical protein
MCVVVRRERSCWFFADYKEEGHVKKGQSKELTCDVIRAWMGNFSKEKVCWSPLLRSRLCHDADSLHFLSQIVAKHAARMGLCCKGSFCLDCFHLCINGLRKHFADEGSLVSSLLNSTGPARGGHQESVVLAMQSLSARSRLNPIFLRLLVEIKDISVVKDPRLPAGPKNA